MLTRRSLLGASTAAVALRCGPPIGAVASLLAPRPAHAWVVEALQVASAVVSAIGIFAKRGDGGLGAFLEATQAQLAVLIDGARDIQNQLIRIQNALKGIKEAVDEGLWRADVNEYRSKLIGQTRNYAEFMGRANRVPEGYQHPEIQRDLKDLAENIRKLRNDTLSHPVGRSYEITMVLPAVLAIECAARLATIDDGDEAFSIAALTEAQKVYREWIGLALTPESPGSAAHQLQQMLDLEAQRLAQLVERLDRVRELGTTSPPETRGVARCVTLQEARTETYEACEYVGGRHCPFSAVISERVPAEILNQLQIRGVKIAPEDATLDAFCTECGYRRVQATRTVYGRVFEAERALLIQTYVDPSSNVKFLTLTALERLDSTQRCVLFDSIREEQSYETDSCLFNSRWKQNIVGAHLQPITDTNPSTIRTCDVIGQIPYDIGGTGRVQRFAESRVWREFDILLNELKADIDEINALRMRIDICGKTLLTLAEADEKLEEAKT